MNLTQNYKSRLVIEYLKRYPNLFSEYEKKTIIAYSESFKEGVLLPSLVSEVFDEVGIIKDEQNIYLGFINLLESVFDIENRRIIEVGGGVIPSLGKKISLRQEKGLITIYDPRLSIYERPTAKMKLVRDTFLLETDVSNYDLMIGFMPCKAAETIIDSAIMHRKDFMIALCEGGMHGEYYDYFEDDSEWRYSLISYARRDVAEAGMGKLKIKYMKEYNNPYPVIYNQRKD